MGKCSSCDINLQWSTMCDNSTRKHPKCILCCNDNCEANLEYKEKNGGSNNE